MTKEELYHYMLAYQKEHLFSEKDQSNFIALLKTLKPDSNPKEELYHYMLAYQKEHLFSEKDQSNFIKILKTLKPDNNSKEEEI
ncbi:hypothetical protein [Aquimarina megaterium]|uniref:hypothetical protein n=2 Tax=Aquimarina TaxID=290174 RepID=UPI0004729769|nr:hypothetical protein [Aquimarina megaterium]